MELQINDLFRIEKAAREENSPVAILFYSPWDEVSKLVLNTYKSLGDLQSFSFVTEFGSISPITLVDLFEYPEFSKYYKITRSPSLVVISNSRFDVIDIPAAIIREMKFLNRLYQEPVI